MIRYRLTEMVMLTLLEVSGLGLMVLGYLQAESPGGLLGWMLLAALGVVLGAAGLWRLHRRQQYGSGLSLKLLGGGGTISLLSGAQLLMQLDISRALGRLSGNITPGVLVLLFGPALVFAGLGLSVFFRSRHSDGTE